MGLGQLCCSSVHHLAGRCRISTPHSIGTRHMALCSRQEHGDISNSCSRKMKSHSRGRVQDLLQFNRIDDRSQSVKRITKHLGFPVVDLFASQISHQTPEFVSWKPEPGAIATDAFNTPLRLSTELSVSSFWPDTNVHKEGNAGAGRLLSHCSSREELAMVSSIPIHA